MGQAKLILDIFRTNNVLLYILLVCSGAITFNIAQLRSVLGVEHIGQPYLAIIGLIFLACLSSFIFLLLKFLGLDLVGRLQNRIAKKVMLDRVSSIKNSEKAILLLFFIQDSETIWLPIQGAEVTSLVGKKIIYLSQKHGRGISNGMQIFHYTMHDGVWAGFKKYYPEYFDDDFDRKATNKFIKENMPSYVGYIYDEKSKWHI